MDLLSPEEWTRLLTGCQREAVHLEMRDVYAVPDEIERFAQWGQGTPFSSEQDQRCWGEWIEMIGSITGSGRAIRRARVVSEPVSDYIRYEWDETRFNVQAGEQVRWLPRRRAAAIALPGADFWLIDDETVVFNHFDGYGEWVANEITTDPGAVELCQMAFATVWKHATPHADYSPA